MFEFDNRTKIKKIRFDVQICRQIYRALIDGFKTGEKGKLWLKKVISKTGRNLLCKFTGMNSYQNHHGEDTIADLARQKLCATLIGTLKEIRDLFDCIPELESMVDRFNEEYLGTVENCVYPFKLNFIGIL